MPSIERFVARDGVKPRRETRQTLEAVEVAVGFQEDVLGKIGCRLAFAGEPETPPRHALEVAAKELLGDCLAVRRRRLTVSNDQSLVGQIPIGHLPDYVGAPTVSCNPTASCNGETVPAGVPEQVLTGPLPGAR